MSNEKANSSRVTRRTTLAGIAGVLGASATGRAVTGSETVEERFVVDTASSSSETWRDGVSVVRELSELDVAIVEGEESALDGLRFTQDFQIQVSPPESYTPEESPVSTDDHNSDGIPEEPGTPSELQWDKDAQGVSDIHSDGVVGDGATVSIIDDGVDPTHPDVAPLYDRSGSNTFAADVEIPGDHIGTADHGTHVAGIAVGTGELAIVGTAPRAELISQNVFVAGGGAPFSLILSGIDASIQEGADVMNLSLGAYPIPASVSRSLTIEMHERAARRAYEAGSLIVASAGNTPVNLDTDGDVVSLPNEVPGFMSISATGPIGFSPDEGGSNPNSQDGGLDAETHLPAIYTSYGSDEIDVSAGGGNAGSSRAGNWQYDLVYSTVPPESTPSGVPFGWKAGTSMAAPQVTGTAALVASENPEATPSQVRQHIRNTASQVDVEYDIQSYSIPYFGRGGILPDSYESETYRGQGHLDTTRAATKTIAFPGGITVDDQTIYPADRDDDGLYEDVNGDGSVDMTDAELLYQIALNDLGGGDADSAFDFNGDGTFDMSDVQYFIREYVE